MKKLLLGSVALAAMLAGPAKAADMPVKAVPVVAVFSWTGCYVGAHVGGKASRSWVNYGNNTLAVAPGTSATDPIFMSGALGGAQIGCNYQFAGGWVIGIEADGSWVQSDGQGVERLFPAFRIQTTEHWLATARGRLGYAWDKWLVYVTGGGAWAGVQQSDYAPVGGLAARQNNTLNAWTVGVGAEYALGYGWSIKGEYLYMEFSESTYFTPTTPIALAEHNVRLRQSVVRFGMNYKFDWGSAVVARY